MHNYDDDRDMYDPEDSIFKCRTCGAECYLQEVYDKDGEPQSRLFQNGKPHVCDHTADFDDLT